MAARVDCHLGSRGSMNPMSGMSRIEASSTSLPSNWVNACSLAFQPLSMMAA